MAVIFQDWLARNAGRAYPLDDAATATDDDGKSLPENLLVDANIWVPKLELGPGRPMRFLYLSSASISEGLVSITILGTAGPVIAATGELVAAPETPFLPIATVSITKPFIPYKNYAVDPLVDGVSGWVMFGQVNDAEDIFLKFSDPSQSILAPKAVRFYEALPVTSIRGGSAFTPIDGDIFLNGLEPFKIESKLRVIEGDVEPTRVLELSLESSADILKAFAGGCGGRPESETCTRNPIQTIGGISPDCTGDVTVTYNGVTVRSIQGGAGQCIDSTQSLAAICASIEAAGLGVDPTCSVSTPFAANFAVDNGDFFFQSGFWFVDAGKLNGATGGFTFAQSGPCLASLPSGVTTRTFTTDISTNPGGANPGIYVCDTIAAAILVTASGSVIAYDKTTDVGILLGSSTVSDTMSVAVSDLNVAGVAILPAFASFFQPTGGSGLFVLNALAPTTIFDTFGATDV